MLRDRKKPTGCLLYRFRESGQRLYELRELKKGLYFIAGKRVAEFITEANGEIRYDFWNAQKLWLQYRKEEGVEFDTRFWQACGLSRAYLAVGKPIFVVHNVAYSHSTPTDVYGTSIKDILLVLKLLADARRESGRNWAKLPDLWMVVQKRWKEVYGNDD